MSEAGPPNVDPPTIHGFGEEWTAFDQSGLQGAEYERWFDAYFHLFPFNELRHGEGFDAGCGSGRWAAGVAPRVRLLHCIDPSEKALAVAKRNLAAVANIRFHLATTETIPLADASQDFGYSLGVLHHIPDTQRALSDCVRKLRPGAPFLLYIYYALDSRPFWYRAIWRVSDPVRRFVAALPFPLRRAIAEGMATFVYWPLARSAKFAERAGVNVANFPLASYRDGSFYSMRTDALDRFGTRLEQRFTRAQIEEMMGDAGLEGIEFSEQPPYWVARGYKRNDR